MKALLLLALSAAVLSCPIPHSRRASGITIQYTSNYPNGPSCDPSVDAEVAFNNNDSPSRTERDLDHILSIQRPLPSTFLMAVPALREGSATQADESKETLAWAGDVRYLCPFVAMLAVSLLGFLACVVQRNTRGIYLHVETPKRQSLSLRAEGEGNSSDENVLEEKPL